MLLSHKHNFLFVHIAKTGGTSVRAALNKLRWRDPMYYPMFLCSKLSKMTGHRIAAKFPRHSKIIAAKEMLPDEYFAQLFKFAIVRNPWDLQISSYHHIKRERPHLMQGINDFESFLKWKMDPERPYQYHVDTSIELQSDYLVDLHGNIIVDFIGQYESLQQDFAEICHRIGIDEIELPHKRKATDRANYQQYYSDETAQLVAEYFKRDIENFSYSF
ncbi:MAG: sulfotransferase family 2 domain-containing protein [Gammaproteobacteria bacterium]